MRTLAIFLFFTLYCSASLISTVSCTVGNGTLEGTTACHIGDGYGRVEAAATGTDTIAGSIATVWAQSTVEVQTTAAPEGFRAATAWALEGAEFVTTGAERSGYVQLTVTNVNDFFGASWVTIADGTSPYAYTFSSCYGRCSSSVTVPFELGETLNVTVGTMVADDAGFADSVGDIHLASAQITFGFLEADAVTPVPVSYTPEPGTLALVLFGSMPLCFAMLRRVMRPR